jgi:hypothetical protein
MMYGICVFNMYKVFILLIMLKSFILWRWFKFIPSEVDLCVQNNNYLIHDKISQLSVLAKFHLQEEWTHSVHLYEARKKISHTELN